MTAIRPIYLDYAATTPVDPRVAAVMMQYLTLDSEFGNPASAHGYGKSARDAVEHAREQAAASLGAEAAEIIFTSGATESDNLAIKGVAQLYQRKGRHIVTMKTEHKAVLDTCQYLEKHGYTVTYLAPQANGELDINELCASLRPDTILVSVMHVNNETGVMQNLEKIAAETSARNIFLHVDAAQSVGKLPLNVRALAVDMISIAAHKIYGPKGVGALYLRKRPRVRVEPLFHGGGHEQGMRSGTLPTHQIAGLGEALSIAAREREHDFAHVAALQELFLSQLHEIPNLFVNGDGAARSPYILSLRFENMLADALIKQMPELALSTASACQGKGTEGSYVLRAMGLTEEQAKSSLRFSFGRFSTAADIDMAAKSLRRLFHLA